MCIYEYRGCSVIQKIDLELQGLPTKAEILFIILSVPVGVSQYSTVKYHNCYHSLNRFLRQHLFGWIAVMLSRRVISALYGNVMSDLGVQERPGWGDRIPGQTRDSVSVRPRPQHQHSTPINKTTAFRDAEMGVICILLIFFHILLKWALPFALPIIWNILSLMSVNIFFVAKSWCIFVENQDWVIHPLPPISEFKGFTIILMNLQS